MFLTFAVSLLVSVVVSIVFFVLLYFLILKGATAQRRVGWLFLAFLWFAMFLPTWAGGLWLTPIGPELGEVPILSYVLVGLAVALLLAALLPRPQPEPEPGPDAPRLRREYVLEAEQGEWLRQLGWFFGIYFLFMIAAIIAAFI